MFGLVGEFARMPIMYMIALDGSDGFFFRSLFSFLSLFRTQENQQIGTIQNYKSVRLECLSKDDNIHW